MLFALQLFQLANAEPPVSPNIAWLMLGGLGVNFVTVIGVAVLFGRRDAQLTQAIRDNTDHRQRLDAHDKTLQVAQLVATGHGKDLDRIVEVMAEQKAASRELSEELRRDRAAYLETSRQFGKAVERLIDLVNAKSANSSPL